MRRAVYRFVLLLEGLVDVLVSRNPLHHHLERQNQLNRLSVFCIVGLGRVSCIQCVPCMNILEEVRVADISDNNYSTDNVRRCANQQERISSVEYNLGQGICA